jgi:hypothetical protein
VWGKGGYRDLYLAQTLAFIDKALISNISLENIPPSFFKGREKDNRLPFIIKV